MSRLPTPGADNGTWGNILNDFLGQSHSSDGTLKAGSVGASQVQDGALPKTKLDTTTQTSLTKADGSLQAFNNLSDVTAGTARTNLGLGTAATMTPATLAADSAFSGTYGRTAYNLRAAAGLDTTTDIHALITAAIATGHNYIVVPYRATPWPATSQVTASGVVIEFEPGAKISLNMTSGPAMVLTNRSYLIGASFTSPYAGPSSAGDASDSGNYSYDSRSISIGNDCVIRDFDQEYCSAGIHVAGMRTIIERAYIRNIRHWKGWGSAIHRADSHASYGIIRDVLIEDCDRGIETETGASFNLVERTRLVRVGPSGYTGQPGDYVVYSFALDCHSHDTEPPCIGNVYQSCEVIDSMAGITCVKSNGSGDGNNPRDNVWENITIEGYTGTAGYTAVYVQGHNNHVRNLRLRSGSGITPKFCVYVADGYTSNNSVDITEASAYYLPLVQVGTGNLCYDNSVSIRNVGTPTGGTDYLVKVYGLRTRISGSIRDVTGTTGYFFVNNSATDSTICDFEYSVVSGETFAAVALISGASRARCSRWTGTLTPSGVIDISTSGGVVGLTISDVTVRRTGGTGISLGGASSYCQVTDTCNLGSGTISDAGTSNRIPRQGGSLDYESTLGRFPGIVASVLAGGSVALANANQAVVIRMRADRAITIAKLCWMAGTQSGNYDIAVLDKAGTVLWAKGSTAFPATGQVTETVTGVTIQAGEIYYLGWVADNTTATIKGITLSAPDMLRTLSGTLRITYVSNSFPFPAAGQVVSVGTTAGYRYPVITVHEA